MADDEQFWRGAMAGMLSGGELVCVGEGERMASSEAQIYRFRKIAVDGKDSRFGVEKMTAERFSTEQVQYRAKEKQVYDEVVARREQLPIEKRMRVLQSESYARKMGMHIGDELAARGLGRN